MAPPFHDGAKCLVRDVATHLRAVEPCVLSTRTAPPMWSRIDGSRVASVPVYSDAGAYTPLLAQNFRAALWVLLASRADVWHFVFAPNPRTSTVGRVLSRARRVPVVQTIASGPRHFEDVQSLLFGDVVVAQSEWMRQRVRDSAAAARAPLPDVRVILPPVSMAITRSEEQREKARAELGLNGDAPWFVYPGDLETSSGAEVSAQIAERIGAALPGAVIVFAFRRKTARALEIANALRSRLPSGCARFVDSTPDVLSLITASHGVIFPVDDLYGKVDLPIVLLEAMVLGVPVVTLAAGPLVELRGATQVQGLDPERWIAALQSLVSECDRAARCVREQREFVRNSASAEHVAAQYESVYRELSRAVPRASD
ncbi:MAG TPA: glycosyltransferase family 4 protein [Polyangiaceae bacterium]|nr:glycosyltransferase family 4 protein [Polyangiaceae bacterium]